MKRQRGMATVEFALVFILFMAMALFVMELGRLMFIYVTAAAATRMGARIAAVCAVTDAPKVKARMSAMLGVLQPANIDITYPAANCAPSTCDPVRVRVSNVVVRLSVPFALLQFSLPAFASAFPAESLDSTNNPLCQ